MVRAQSCGQRLDSQVVPYAGSPVFIRGRFLDGCQQRQAHHREDNDLCGVAPTWCMGRGTGWHQKSWCTSLCLWAQATETRAGAGVAVTHSVTASQRHSVTASHPFLPSHCKSARAPPLAGAAALHQPISPHIIASHSLSLLLTYYHSCSPTITPAHPLSPLSFTLPLCAPPSLRPARMERSSIPMETRAGAGVAVPRSGTAASRQRHTLFFLVSRRERLL